MANVTPTETANSTEPSKQTKPSRKGLTMEGTERRAYANPYAVNLVFVYYKQISTPFH